MVRVSVLYPQGICLGLSPICFQLIFIQPSFIKKLSAKEMRLRSAETSKRRKSSSSSPSNHTRSQQKIHLKDGMRVAKERKRDRAKEGVEMKKGMSGNKETVLSAQLRAKKRVQEKKKEMRMYVFCPWNGFCALPFSFPLILSVFFILPHTPFAFSLFLFSLFPSLNLL